MSCTATQTMLVVLFSQYCANDRALPTYLSPSIPGACLTSAQQTTQANCMTNGLASGSYPQSYSENVGTGNTYYLPCGITGGTAAQWETPSFNDGPPCLPGYWPCSVTTFSLMGYTLDEYCTGQYQNSEQFPPGPPPTSGTNCMAVSACGNSMSYTVMLQTGQDPTNTASYYVFQYNCGSTAVPGYSYTPTTCANFSQYAQKNGPVVPGPKQKSNAKTLSGGAIAGIVIALVAVITVGALFAIPQTRELIIKAGNDFTAMVKEKTGGGPTPA